MQSGGGFATLVGMIPHRFLFVLLATVFTVAAAEPAVRWWEPHTGKEANGPHVLGLWKFDNENLLRDESSHKHSATPRGAVWNGAGRFGGCLESSAGYPVEDKSHGIHVKRTPVLSPGGAFSLEFWARPKAGDAFPAEIAPTLLDMKYVADNHTGFALSLTRAGGDGSRALSVEMGLGTRTERWNSDRLTLSTNGWTHLAFTYDAAGTLRFFVYGEDAGGDFKPGAGAMAAAVRHLAIGDRMGSLYRGFPGYLDEVRMTTGVRQFRPVDLELAAKRFVFRRMSASAELDFELINRTGAEVSGAKVVIDSPGKETQTLPIPVLAKDGRHRIKAKVDSALRPGEYEAAVAVELPDWGDGDGGYQSKLKVPFVIVARPLPERMPVVMWGVGGTEGVIREIPRLKEIGFTHCLGLRADYGKIWKEGSKATPGTPEAIREGRDMLNVALENDIGIVSSLSPARWLRTAEPGKRFLRVNREGKHYGREDVSGQFTEVQDFCRNTGLAMNRAYGDHPAYQSALLHTEVRGESQVSFHEVDIAAYRKATGLNVPEAVKIKNGVRYKDLPNFPKDRVIADDDPILRYLQWFWREGDGWNGLTTRLHEGLQADMPEQKDFWTFHDPACRVPSISGSGGGANVLAHWTYSYPDPIRIGLCTDELFEMARVNGRGQDVMKMTQVIWYRSQTAPQNATPADPSPWVDRDPDAAYITIAPMHLREAFWWKLARPIKGIMYHGWQSLVETDSTGGYRHTNPNTRRELKRLIDEVVTPLGPTLRQVPDAETDVAFLESFTSQMFARRGTYGWNHTWAGDMYHVLMYAQLQPRVLYEESLLRGLDGVKVLVMADCDVLTKSGVAAIKKFQARGGLVVGDAEVCPAIKPDFVIKRFSRVKTKAGESRVRLLAEAGKLRDWLDDRYQWPLKSDNADVVTRRRRFGTTDYLFAVNDRREFGGYVGAYGMVMENGLPAQTTVRLRRKAGHVYDLKDRRAITAEFSDGGLGLPLQLGPCEGRVLMVTEKPIREVEVNAPKNAAPGTAVDINIAITDGSAPIDAIIPMHLEILDPEGVPAEFSGHYGAVGGRLAVTLDLAPNDRPGVWEIRVAELASGRSSRAYLRVARP